MSDHELCHRLHCIANARQRFGFPFDAASLPLNGIYVLFEVGERAHGGDRIVRVGTHTGQNQLPSRLKQHFLLENKDRSIFRKNIGRAILAKAEDPFATDWELDLTTTVARQQHGGLVDLKRQQEIERDVSRTIQSHFKFAIFRVASKEDRLRLEARLISTCRCAKTANRRPDGLVNSPQT